VVDAADYIIWRKTLGQVGPDLAADGNHNGEVDSGDYTVWSGNYGNIVGSGSGGSDSNHLAMVPEPTGLVLVAWGVILLNGALRRTRRQP
jgi:hypothetical protein